MKRDSVETIKLLLLIILVFFLSSPILILGKVILEVIFNKTITII